MNKINRWIIVTALIIRMVFAGVSIAGAETINVPADFPVIQDAIDTADNGDEILVAAAGGPYVENIVFDGTKTIIVKTEDGAIINGNANGSVVRFINGDNSTLDGFTIVNGSGTEINEYGDFCGGGIICESSSPTITNCIIKDNSTKKGPSSNGGGIYLSSSSPTIIHCIIKDNSAFNAGGGIALGTNSSAKILKCIIKSNSAIYGGGISYGGQSTSPLIANCVIMDNVAVQYGGGLYVHDSSGKIVNCSISANKASYGGAFYCTEQASPTIKYSIIWGNKAIREGNEAYLYRPGTTIIIIDSDIDPSHVTGGDGFPSFSNIITADPSFLGTYNLHLKSDSPCIDKIIVTTQVIFS